LSKSNIKRHFDNITSFRNQVVHHKKISSPMRKEAQASIEWFGMVIGIKEDNPLEE